MLPAQNGSLLPERELIQIVHDVREAETRREVEFQQIEDARELSEPDVMSKTTGVVRPSVTVKITTSHFVTLFENFVTHRYTGAQQALLLDHLILTEWTPRHATTSNNGE
ncbi:hypothetical protein K503DRAFT_787763 [Rhizopogon vinicolor AM-OR11-026]|uniref:Uncharacterized protein n=1 Tax=Rhizopogon vinicolor AM-OR11-026 TaxID=1314800 RepID=A0A1B7MG39_9AGAM|nr:hypothetical protein K503DRAFT_787763 [Rhizopogon vinicolor AM-OR11-026]